MKKICLIALLLLVSGKSFSQDYMITIVEGSCKCLEGISDSLDTEQLYMELGLCMIEVAMPYKKQLKQDYGIDMDNVDVEGEKLGKIIGLKMVSVCPNVLTKLTRKAGGESKSRNTQTVTGIITKVENDFFVVFSLKDDTGKTGRYYWLTFVDAESDLPSEYSKLTGKEVTITYEAQEFFDPRINEYRPFMVMKKISQE